MLYWFTNKLIFAYVYSTIAFLLLLLLSNKVRNKKTAYLNISNGIILIALALNFVISLLNALDCKKEAAQAFSGFYGINGWDNCFNLFFWAGLVVFLFQFFFILKKFRIKVSTTIACVVQLLLYTRAEYIVIIITKANRDYLPSSWSTYYNQTAEELWTIGYSALYFIICWTIPGLKLRSKEAN